MAVTPGQALGPQPLPSPDLAPSSPELPQADPMKAEPSLPPPAALILGGLLSLPVHYRTSTVHSGHSLNTPKGQGRESQMKGPSSSSTDSPCCPAPFPFCPQTPARPAGTRHRVHRVTRQQACHAHASEGEWDRRSWARRAVHAGQARAERDICCAGGEGAHAALLTPWGGTWPSNNHLHQAVPVAWESLQGILHLTSWLLQPATPKPWP